MSRRPRGSDLPEWEEYPLGFWGQCFAAVCRTSIAALVGIGLMGALILSVGLVGEEGVLPSRELARALDQLSRISIAAVACGALLVWFVAAVSQLGWQLSVSRALVRAAEAGAPATRVPHPYQLELAEGTPGSFLASLIYLQAAVLGVFVLIGVPVIAFNPFEGAWIVIAVPLAWIAILALLWMELAALRRGQAARSARLGEQWPTWARMAARNRAARTSADEGHGRRGLFWLGNALVGLSGALGGVAMMLIYGVLFFTHPGAQRWPGGRLGDRAELSPELEGLVDQLTIVFAGLVVAAVLAALAGTAVGVVGSWRERASLRAALAEPDGERPPVGVLQRQVGRRVAPLAQILAAAGGGVLCFGLAGLALGTPAMESFADVYRGSVDLFAPLRPAFLWAVVVSSALLASAFAVVVWVSVRGREWRNELHARWPTAIVKAS